jgi:hypothetical protein
LSNHDLPPSRIVITEQCIITGSFRRRDLFVGAGVLHALTSVKNATVIRNEALGPDYHRGGKRISRHLSTAELRF